MVRRCAIWSTIVPIVLAAAGCGSQCRDIAARRTALGETVRAAEPHGRLDVPFAQADRILAETLAAQPIEREIGPDLLPTRLPIRLPAITARVREVRIVPAAPGRVGMAIQIEIRDGEQELVTLALRTEVKPEVVRDGTATSLEIGLGAKDLVSVQPVLGPDATRKLTDALARWLPEDLRQRVPRLVLERGAREIARHLTGGVYKALRATLLERLGEVTRLRVRLPDLPIASAAVRSSAEAFSVDLQTDLPVRRGLGPARPIRASAPIQLRLSGSAVAAIANWAIDGGRLPRRYTRTLKPDPDGDYRPILEWVGARARRPLLVHIFQERGGCSYFAVGVRPEISVAGGQLVASLRDREIERVQGSAALRIGAWLKSLVSSAADVTRRVAATTQIAAGGRRFDTRITGAALVGDELILELEVSPAPPATSRSGSAYHPASRDSSGPPPSPSS